jgi:hypothetical protein
MINEVDVACREFQTISRQLLNGPRMSGLRGMQLSWTSNQNGEGGARRETAQIL